MGAQGALGGEVGQHRQVSRELLADAGDDLNAVPAAVPGGKQLIGKGRHDKAQAAPGHQGCAAIGGSGLTDAIKNDIIALARAAEILCAVVDDRVRAEAAGKTCIGGRADGGDMGAEVVGQLDGGGADGPGGADHQDTLARSQFGAVAQVVKGGEGAEGQGGGLGQVKALGQGHQTVGADGDLFGMGAHGKAGGGKNAVAHGDAGHAGSDPGHLTGHDDAEDGLARTRQTEDQPQDQAETGRHVRAANAGVAGIERSCVLAHDDLTGLGARRCDGLDPDDVGGAVAGDDGGFHGGCGHGMDPWRGAVCADGGETGLGGRWFRGRSRGQIWGPFRGRCR